MISRRTFCALLAGAANYLQSSPPGLAQTLAGQQLNAGPLTDEAQLFKSPPLSARPYVLWMWMGSNISKTGITLDLEAMKEAGIGGATIFSLADTTIPWAGVILKSPTSEIVTWTEPWWEMVRHAASEAHRLGLELILHNCAGYESSGGTWITPELSMQEVVWSERRVAGGARVRTTLDRAKVDPHPHALFPDVYIPSLGKVGVPIVKAREAYYRDIAVLAVAPEGVIHKEQTVDLSGWMKANGDLEWDAPAGDWVIYRFGHTTTGAMIQPAQWDAMGLECDKMSKEAVTFHVHHVLGEMKKHLGDLMGKTLTTLYFDSYEAGDPTWTPKMREEFQQRRGYDLTAWLPVFADRTVISEAETARFQQDFKRTLHDLYRDCYWATPGPLAHEAGVSFVAEPYDGPWEISEVVKFLDMPTVEFWTTDNHYSPVDVEPVVEAARKLRAPLIAAEAFTTDPKFAQWNEYPAWLKPIGDAAFCAGVNRVNVHHFVLQPWSDKYKPGNTMGQWGIHLGRNQTWWKPGKAWITYLWRCQYMLQRGEYVPPSKDTSPEFTVLHGAPEMQSIHRRDGSANIYFLANIAGRDGTVRCTFPASGMQPELWDPVWGTTRDLTDLQQSDGSVSFDLDFAPAQSCFIVFRKLFSGTCASRQNFPPPTPIFEIDGPWTVSFDPAWGGPRSIVFDSLMDWTKHPNRRIQFYSGTATYRKTLSFVSDTGGQVLYLDLGAVKHLAEVTINGRSLGVVWTAPWRIDVTEAMRKGDNLIEIAVTNVWANRLIGDEQQPPDLMWELGDPKIRSGSFLKEFPEWFLKGEQRPSKERYTFTTWNYFNASSPLTPSGLIGPVRLMRQNPSPKT